ncbi:hypothetical protein [Cellulomonas fimi]|uniref:ATP/GTP-binding protein n=1 Tax=Cellulomonas fimi TaxID=1708 RepID=A0A7Y0LXB3_CELFI|nr:hypothetical protein [Cellulomonas fimi]NMR19961.1 hypothetical protein [Cellulomonas fimi]
MPSGRRSKRRPWGGEPAPVDVQRALGGRRTEDAPDGSWTVQTVTGSTKSYRCPGCQQLIAPGAGHVVAWPAEGLLGAESALADRRHWHRSCWDARGRRR